MPANRLSIDLDGQWLIAFDPDNRGVRDDWAHHSPAQSRSIVVPSVWNTLAPGYEGAAFYHRVFAVPATWRNHRIVLRFGAVNYLAEIWVNGRPAGSHEGGYTPFSLDITSLLRFGEQNSMVARVVDPPYRGEIDGLRLAEVACAKETWYYRYGGIWGHVSIEARPALACEDLFIYPDPAGAPRAFANLWLTNHGHRRDVECRITISEGIRIVASAKRLISVDPGSTDVTLTLDLAQAERWSPEHPVLYRGEAELSAPEGPSLDAIGVPFGWRHFDVVDGQFLLNGQPILLKGILYQPNFPATLAYPPNPAMPERELRIIKQAGFNLVRFHLRPPPPEYLDVADRLGLLAYVETPLAWIAPSTRLQGRCQAELRETIQHNRNHPGVVMWGIFNENQRSAALVGRDLLGYARQLDPSRPVIDNSGGTAAIDQDGSWTASTQIYPVTCDHPVDFNDLHLYFGAPVAPKVQGWLASFPIAKPNVVTQAGYGTPPIAAAMSKIPSNRKVFVSELGYGGLPDLDNVLAKFDRDDLIDAAEVRSFRDSLAAGLAARGLDRVLGGIAGVAEATQQIQALGNVRQVDALRCNPRASGYVITQFNDAAWEFHAGVVDLWRQPKLALAGLAAANSPHRLVAFLDRHAFQPGDAIPVRSVFVDDQKLTGPALLRLVLRSEMEELFVSQVDFPITGQRSENRLIVPAPLHPGRYTLEATVYLGDHALATRQEALLVLPQVEWPRHWLDWRGHLALARPDPAIARLLPEVRAADGGLLLVSRPNSLSVAAWHRILDATHNGARVIVFPLSPEGAGRVAKATAGELAIAAFPSIGCFVGCFHYVKRSPPFRDLPCDCLAGEEYAGILPRYSLTELGDASPAGAFTSRRDEDDKSQFQWFADIQTVTWGRGEFTFCQYDLRPSLAAHPVAQLMLRNLIAATFDR